MLIRLILAQLFLVVGSSTLWAQRLRDAVSDPPPRAIDREPDLQRRPAQPGDRNEPGYLGLITDDRRDAGRAIRVVRVVEGSPAAEAGFRADDLILSLDSTAVRSLDHLARELQPRLPGDKVVFEVTRDGEPLTIDVTLGRRPSRDQRQFEFGRIPERLPGPVSGDTPFDFGPREGIGASRGQLLGVRTAPVTEEVRQRLALREPRGAVVVSRVVGSPAERAGIPLDAVIIAVDGQPVGSPLDLARLIAAAGPGGNVEVTFVANGDQRKTTVRLTELAGDDVAMPARSLPDGASGSILPGNAERERAELLERRVRELEHRVQELERLLRQRG
jgi:S1-C subfamily serine protease